MTQDQIHTIILPAHIDPCDLMGVHDAYLFVIQKNIESRITLRGNRLLLKGSLDDKYLLEALIKEMTYRLDNNLTIDSLFIEDTLKALKLGNFAAQELNSEIILSYRGRLIRPKTVGQKRYIAALTRHIVTFCFGPAGSGKTYLAMAQALSELKDKKVSRIILTRPVVEAGESLGFLPGSLEEKIDPYIRPLYDALFSMCDPDKARRLINDGIIEIVPLAFMRGRTLDDAFIILDEAQNATSEQLKMFLTRLGFNSHMVITGDISQSDLPHNQAGLASIEKILGDISQIAFVRLDKSDVVRHSLVAHIVEAYAQFEEEQLKRLKMPSAKDWDTLDLIACTSGEE